LTTQMGDVEMVVETPAPIAASKCVNTESCFNENASTSRVFKYEYDAQYTAQVGIKPIIVNPNPRYRPNKPSFANTRRVVCVIVSGTCITICCVRIKSNGAVKKAVVAPLNIPATAGTQTGGFFFLSLIPTLSSLSFHLLALRSLFYTFKHQQNTNNDAHISLNSCVCVCLLFSAKRVVNSSDRTQEKQLQLAFHARKRLNKASLAEQSQISENKLGSHKHIPARFNCRFGLEVQNRCAMI